MLIDKKKNVLLDKSRLLGPSTSVAFFGILLAVSLLFNIALFLRIQNVPSGIAERFFPTRDGQLKAMMNKMGKDDTGKVIVDNKVWIRNDDPLFDVIYLKDDQCKNCVDLEPLQKQLVASLPTTDAKIILTSSEEGKKILADGVSVVPAILFSSPFVQTATAKNLAQTGAVTALKNGMFEFRTTGNKRILSESQLPTLAQPDVGKVTIVGYVDYLSPERNTYFAQLIPAIISQYKDKVDLSLRPFVDNLPSMFAAEAVLCGADASQIAGVRAQFLAEVQKILAEGTKQISEEQVGKISSTLASLLGLKEDVLICYSSRQKAQLITQLSAEAKQLGITGAPAFFVGDRFLAGAQPVNTFLAVIGEVLLEKGLIEATPEQPVASAPAVSPEQPAASVPVTQ